MFISYDMQTDLSIVRKGKPSQTDSHIAESLSNPVFPPRMPASALAAELLTCSLLLWRYAETCFVQAVKAACFQSAAFYDLRNLTIRMQHELLCMREADTVDILTYAGTGHFLEKNIQIACRDSHFGSKELAAYILVRVILINKTAYRINNCIVFLPGISSVRFL